MIGRLTAEEIEDLLLSNNLGRIGCRDGEQVYIVPVNYVYDGKCIIAHSAAGKKIDLMRKHPLVCFEIDQMESFTNWKSVIAWGEFQELIEERERYRAMQLFVERTMKLKVSETAVPPELFEHRIHPQAPGNIKPVIYRIVLNEKSGRFESENK